MINEEVQAEPKKIRKSRITKLIQRTLNTAKFESIVISVSLDEEIEWSTLEERDFKANNWNMILLKDFKETQEKVLEELGLSVKKAYFKTLADKDDRSDNDHSMSDLDTIG